ncbi:MAG: TPR domain protein [Candidatus Beckwithbacteria bacterium GW2011_GWA2_43_10]|uniref:TPR domain protein n=1 Tax=Candidatus Beckwithbacteria bacterium GW2011_GWA2_43_10 TaxID=1618369 RepID=A0A0G1C3G7_9BACT|nr:MAG: TPR domain protein [Candidatus Beckwithbacteria bacterium GW2011_GWA2_43_10]
MKWRLLFLAGLVGIAYLWTVNFAFLSDDIYGIVNNPEIFKFSWVWQNPTVILNRLVYFIISNVFGIVPWPFRLVNIFVHLMTVIGVMVLVDKLINKTVAVVAAALVAVHPLMIESVTWISGNGYSWYGMLLMWSLVFYIRAGKSGKQWLISIGLFLAALEFSEKAAVLPGILLVYRLVIDRKRGKWPACAGRWDLIPYIALSALWLVMNIRGVGARLNYLETEYNSQVEIESAFKVSPLVQTPVALSSYLGLIIWPDKLTLYHSEMNFTPVKFRVMAGITIIYLLATAWLLWRRKLAGFFLSWLVIGLSPTLVPLGVAWIVAERYAYFGAIAIFILIAWGLVGLSEKPKWMEAGWTIIVIVICLLLIRTLVRNSDWQDQDHLWLAAERTSPTSPQNHNNLGDLYGRRGDLQLAEWHFKKAIELNPNYADAMHNLGNTYVRMGKLEEAIKMYEAALQNKPSLWQSEQQLKEVREYLQKGLTKESSFDNI